MTKELCNTSEWENRNDCIQCDDYETCKKIGRGHKYNDRFIQEFFTILRDGKKNE